MQALLHMTRLARKHLKPTRKAKQPPTNTISDQLTKLTLSNGTSILHSYDKEGNELTKRFGTDQTYQYEYDVMGKLVKTTDPLGNVLKSEYDANSNLTKTVSANGNEVSLTYDGTDRVKSKAYNGTEKYNFTYDKTAMKRLSQTKNKIQRKRTFDNKTA